MLDQQDRLLNQMAQEEQEALLKWDEFRDYAIDKVAECLDTSGDLQDTLHTLDLQYDDYAPLENWQINEIVIEAVKILMKKEK